MASALVRTCARRRLQGVPWTRRCAEVRCAMSWSAESERASASTTRHLRRGGLRPRGVVACAALVVGAVVAGLAIEGARVDEIVWVSWTGFNGDREFVVALVPGGRALSDSGYEWTWHWYSVNGGERTLRVVQESHEDLATNVLRRLGWETNHPYDWPTYERTRTNQWVGTSLWTAYRVLPRFR